MHVILHRGLACALVVLWATGLFARDPATTFAERELRRVLGDVADRVTLQEDASLKAQQWRIRTVEDGSLVISGRDGMGIAYGVFSFLEKHVGVRWFAPDTEVIPDLKDWTMPVLDETASPKYDYREMYVGADLMDSVWRLRNKETCRAACGVGVGTGSPGDCHTFDALHDGRDDAESGGGADVRLHRR